jgi:hypothetical protein
MQNIRLSPHAKRASDKSKGHGNLLLPLDSGGYAGLIAG